MSDWKPVAEVPELATAVTAAAPVVPAAYQAPSNNPYAAPQSQPARSYGAQQPMVAPVNGGGLLAFAICVTVMCCLPFGVVGIVYAAQINTKLAAGDVLGAVEAGRKSKMWSWIGLGVGLVGILAYLALVAAAASSGNL